LIGGGLAMEKMYGVRIRHRVMKTTSDYWFDTPEQMERQMKIFNPQKYEVIEYLDNQAALIFDIEQK
jgi:hypothetical protein